MNIQTSSLRGAALDWAVAKCEKFSVFWDGNNVRLLGVNREECFSPSTDWNLAGPIIERECIDLKFYGDLDGVRTMMNSQDGETIIEEWNRNPLVAAMLAYVASVFGDEIEIPDELIKTKEIDHA